MRSPRRWLIRIAALLLFATTAACGGESSRTACPVLDACTTAQAADAAGIAFGAAIANPEGALERATIGIHFNAVVAENAMKWGSLAPTVGDYDFARADALVDFAESRGATVRGHVLVWRDQQPADLRGRVLAAADPASTLRGFLAEHIETVAGRYRGRIASWDVVNEPLALIGTQRDRNLFQRVLGDTYLDEIFALARAADPEAALFLNEFFFSHHPNDARVVAFRTLVEELLARGVPIDGVGIQGHFWGAPAEIPEREAFTAMLRSFTELGLMVEITEVDVSLRHFDGTPDPLAAQARTYGDIVAACRAVHGCRAIMTWGMADSSSWLDRNPPWSSGAPHLPLLLDTGGQPKPAYVAVRAALLGLPYEGKESRRAGHDR